MSIIINNLTYIHPNKEVLFANLSLSVSQGQKVAIIGRNGTGKSTLLRILAGELCQSAGEISYSERPYYVAQHSGQYDHHTIAQTLGLEQKLQALHAILNGEASDEHFSTLNDDWNLEERIRKAFATWHIEHLKPSQQMATLSGGEKTKVFLSGIAIHNPEIVLLDEPSNHLDSEARALLHEFIASSKKTILMVSHDQALLHLPEMTLEIYNNTIHAYGGNYTFYKKQKERELLALHTKLEEKTKLIKQTEKRTQEIVQQRKRQEARGKLQNRQGGIPRIVSGNLARQAEQSSSKMKAVQNDKTASLSNEALHIRQQLVNHNPLLFDIKSTNTHTGKLLIEAREINVVYESKTLWSSALTFRVSSGDRVKITGRNGMGKTTLFKIIRSSLQVTQGEIHTAKFRSLYLDQEYSLLNNNFTIFEQIQHANNRHLLEHELRMLLHYHQFSAEFWDKKCQQLSGGEKLKLILCCLAVSEQAPDILLLDEPTNNLDTHSMAILTEMVKSFKGTILVVSHDPHFLQEIRINKEITLS